MIRPLVTIDHAAIAGMLANAKFLAVVPCLKIPAGKLKQLRPGCTQCSRDENAKKQKQIITETLDCLKELAPPRRAELKKLLNAKSYRIITDNGRGGTDKRTY
jgi:hypothetical protein